MADRKKKISKERAIERLECMLHQVSDPQESGFCSKEERDNATEDAAALVLAIQTLEKKAQ